MATGKITVDEGTTTNLATHTISEDAVTKHLPRSVLANSSGTEMATSGAPLRTDPTGTTTQPIAGAVAHDSADSGNPVKIGGKARQTNPTAVADADRVDGFFDDVGRQVVVLNQARDLVGNQVTTITASTSETTIVTAGGAGVFNDLTSLTITNSSSTATLVTLKDATGGTTRAIYSIAANGGITIPFPTPKAQATANNNWTLTCGNSVSSIYVAAEFVKNV